MPWKLGRMTKHSRGKVCRKGAQHVKGYEDVLTPVGLGAGGTGGGQRHRKLGWWCGQDTRMNSQAWLSSEEGSSPYGT